MKNLFYIFFLAIFCVGFSENPIQKPYEATWMEITKTSRGYIVYNYPSLWDDGATKSPMIIKVKNDTLTWIIFSDQTTSYRLSEGSAEHLDDGSYLFKVGNYFKFEYVDPAHHIAKWTVYYGEKLPTRIMTEYLYIDSLYNKFPIVDYVWR